MKAKRVLIITALSALAVVVLQSLLWLIEVVPLFSGNDVIDHIFLSAITVTIASFVLIMPLELLKRNRKILPLMSVVLTALSVLMFLYLIWLGGDENDGFLRMSVIFALFAVLFTIICTNRMKIGNNYLPLQIVVYALMSVAVVFVIMLVYGVNLNDVLLKILIADAVLSVGGEIALVILQRKTVRPVEETVTISLEEYDALKSEIARLKQKLNEKDEK